MKKSILLLILLSSCITIYKTECDCLNTDDISPNYYWDYPIEHFYVPDTQEYEWFLDTGFTILPWPYPIIKDSILTK